MLDDRLHRAYPYQEEAHILRSPSLLNLVYSKAQARAFSISTSFPFSVSQEESREKQEAEKQDSKKRRRTPPHPKRNNSRAPLFLHRTMSQIIPGVYIARRSNTGPVAAAEELARVAVVIAADAGAMSSVKVLDFSKDVGAVVPSATEHYVVHVKNDTKLRMESTFREVSYMIERGRRLGGVFLTDFGTSRDTSDALTFAVAYLMFILGKKYSKCMVGLDAPISGRGWSATLLPRLLLHIFLLLSSVLLRCAVLCCALLCSW